VPDVMDQVQEAVQVYQGLDEDELYRQLGLRMAQIREAPQVAGYFRPPATFAAPAGFAPADLIGLGRRVFGSVAKMGYEIVCGADTPDGSGHLEQLIASLGKNPAAATAALAGLLATSLPLAPVACPIIAALIIGKVAPQSLDNLCKVWQAKIA
jgi:hypothetical protein